METAQKYARINIWPEHIPIHNLLPPENYCKSEQARRFTPFYS